MSDAHTNDMVRIKVSTVVDQWVKVHCKEAELYAHYLVGALIPVVRELIDEERAVPVAEHKTP